MFHFLLFSECASPNISLALVYHGTTSEEVRPYVFRLARQFYSSYISLKIIRYTILDQRRYQLHGRKVHPFKEVLNDAVIDIRETDDTNMFRDVASFFGNTTLIHIILIEDGTQLTKVSSSDIENEQNVSRIYRVQKDKQMKQHATVIGAKNDAETVIKLDRWDRLSFNGAILFPGICNGN